AGYVGYVSQGAILGKSRCYAMQRGPTSSGLGWLLSVINVSVTPYTYSEDFTGDNAVLSRDNMRVSFRVHLLWKVDAERVKDLVEHYTTLDLGKRSEEVVRVAYDNFLHEPLRTYARDEVQKLNGLEIKDRITEVGDLIAKRMGTLTKETPFAVISAVVGNIQYPKEVADAVAEKMAATQVLERKQTEIEIEQREAQKRVVQAEGIGKAMAIINERLTSQYLQHEAIEKSAKPTSATPKAAGLRTAPRAMFASATPMTTAMSETTATLPRGLTSSFMARAGPSLVGRFSSSLMFTTSRESPTAECPPARTRPRR